MQTRSREGQQACSRGFPHAPRRSASQAGVGQDGPVPQGGDSNRQSTARRVGVWPRWGGRDTPSSRRHGASQPRVRSSSVISLAPGSARQGLLWAWGLHRRPVAGCGIRLAFSHAFLHRAIPRCSRLYNRPAVQIQARRREEPINAWGTPLPAAGPAAAHAGARRGRCHCLPSAPRVWTAEGESCFRCL